MHSSVKKLAHTTANIILAFTILLYRAQDSSIMLQVGTDSPLSWLLTHPIWEGIINNFPPPAREIINYLKYHNVDKIRLNILYGPMDC